MHGSQVRILNEEEEEGILNSNTVAITLSWTPIWGNLDYSKCL